MQKTVPLGNEKSYVISLVVPVSNPPRPKRNMSQYISSHIDVSFWNRAKITTRISSLAPSSFTLQTLCSLSPLCCYALLFSWVIRSPVHGMFVSESKNPGGINKIVIIIHYFTRLMSWASITAGHTSSRNTGKKHAVAHSVFFQHSEILKKLFSYIDHGFPCENMGCLYKRGGQGG